MGMFDFLTGLVDPALTSVFGKDIGGFFSSKGPIAQGTQEWTNPATQGSFIYGNSQQNRNPIYSLLTGEGGLAGSRKRPSDWENTLNQFVGNQAAQYGVYSLGAPDYSGGGEISNLTGTESFSELGGGGTSGPGGTTAGEMGGVGGAGASDLAPLGAGATNLSPEETAALGTAGNFSESPNIATLDSPAAITGATPGGGGGWDMDNMMSGPLPWLMGAGALSNLGGQYLKSQQDRENLNKYLDATTWTDARKNAYLGAVDQSAAGTYGAAETAAKGTLAEQIAGRGTGGGGYGQRAQAISEEKLNKLAQSRAGALTTVSSPTGVSPSPFMAQTSPGAENLIGAGGMAGNMSQMMMTMALLSKLGLFQAS